MGKGVDFPTKAYQIFSCLPTLILRCVSNLWKSLLSSGSSFFYRMFNSGNSSNPWIFMYDPSNEQVQLYLKHTQKFINHHDGLSFEFLLDTDPFKTQETQKEYLLSSCSNGLVLYSAEKRVSFPEENSRFYYVCNPMTKQWVSLPPRPESNGSGHKFFYCAELVCDASLTPSNYKVVYIDSPNGATGFQFHIFSSDTGEWKTSKVPKPGASYYFYEMIIRHGVLYWPAEENYTRNKMLIAYNLENNNASQCKEVRSYFPRRNDCMFSKESDRTFFGESQGSIYYGVISISDEHTDYDDEPTSYKAFIDMWRLEDDYSITGELEWQMVHQSIELKGYRSSKKVEAIYINPVDRNVIIIVDRGCCLAYNIKTLTHKVLRGCPIPSKIKDHELRPIFITPKPTVIPLIIPTADSVEI